MTADASLSSELAEARRRLAQLESLVEHSPVAVVVMDPDERWLGGTGEALFVDPETELEVPASVTDVRAAYRSTVEEVIEEWRSMLSSFGASYEVIVTDQPFGVPLRRAFAARQRLP